MRKLIVILTSTLTFTLLTISTYGQMLQISSMNGDEICQGYASDNQAIIQVTSGIPSAKPENTYITYVWTSTHDNGTKVWDTNLSSRKVPIPWTGEYTVQVVMQYVRHGQTRPYAAFWSNKVKVMGKVCKP
jgi:hypothetical protein